MGNNATISEIEIFNLMKRVGIPCSLKGYGYIKDAVLRLVDEKSKNEHYNISVTKDLYRDLGKKYNDTPTRVERAIRHAVEVGFYRGDIDFLQNIFGYSYNKNNGRPTNSEFVYGLTEYLTVHNRNKQEESE